MEVVYCLIGVIFGVLNLILFFKIWGMTNDVKELKYALLEEIQKKYIQAPSADAVQGMKSELSKLEEQDNSNLSPKESLANQFKIAIKKYKIQCATNAIPEDKARVGILSIVKAYQKRALDIPRSKLVLILILC